MGLIPTFPPFALYIGKDIRNVLGVDQVSSKYIHYIGRMFIRRIL